MFESLLGSVLDQVLGKYIQDLNSSDLNVSIWSGALKLQNIKLRSDIFT
jgi:vacuolar protein sorting-associated protein 13A/C